MERKELIWYRERMYSHTVTLTKVTKKCEYNNNKTHKELLEINEELNTLTKENA